MIDLKHDLHRLTRDEVLAGLKVIVGLTNLQFCLPRIAEAHRIAKLLLEKEQDESFGREGSAG